MCALLATWGQFAQSASTPNSGHCSLDLLHIDFTSIGMTMELNKLPRVTNVLVFQDHFTKHILAYVIPIKQLKLSLSSCIRVTSWSSGPQPGSWVIGVFALWASSSMNCARSLAWRNYEPCLTSPKLMGWWRGHTKHNENDQEAGRGQKGWLARTPGWDSTHLQCHLIHCDGVQST